MLQSLKLIIAYCHHSLKEIAREETQRSIQRRQYYKSSLLEVILRKISMPPRPFGFLFQTLNHFYPAKSQNRRESIRSFHLQRFQICQRLFNNHKIYGLPVLVSYFELSKIGFGQVRRQQYGEISESF